MLRDLFLEARDMRVVIVVIVVVLWSRGKHFILFLESGVVLLE